MDDKDTLITVYTIREIFGAGQGLTCDSREIMLAEIKAALESGDEGLISIEVSSMTKEEFEQSPVFVGF